LSAKTYTFAQNGALVYVTDTATGSSQASNVNGIGLYVFEGNVTFKWIKVTSNSSQDLRLVGPRNHITQDAGVLGNGTGVGIGTDNIAIGSLTLNKNTSGISNVGIGSFALNSNTTGVFNIAVGQGSLQFNTTGFRNNAFGNNALSFNVSGGDNNAFGANALAPSTGNQNIAMGTNALGSSTTGNDNTALGHNSLTSSNGASASNNTVVGSKSLFNNTSGSNNTAIGYNTLVSNTTGSYNIAIGSGADIGGSASNRLNIGNSLFATGIGSLTSNFGINTSSPNSSLQVAGSLSANIRSVNTLAAENDYTIIVTGNISLPTPGVTNSGRIYNLLCNGSAFTVTAAFKDASGTFATFGLNNATGARSIVVQSDGTNWWIISQR